ncbi:MULTISPECIES: carotenoid biosynthesis protein [Bradyrhizobium]|uniref:carotenoid biosynthesis protein n=1 Tax=Bradyrhizobium TaxID=374 RepID=UPI0004160D31|nr:MULTISPECIES: carotenoid biosynthesis protein [Bradyrhizobium]
MAIAGILAAAIWFSWNPTPVAQALAALFIACALIHATFAYGARSALVLFVTCNAIAFAMENLSAATAFPFGTFHFVVGADLPQIGLIPIIVGPVWFVVGYFSWVVASVLLDHADRQLDRPFNLVALPIVAAFVMTQWNLVTDAPNATIAKAWIWHGGGGMFGVPLSNYLGWLLTSWLICQAFALHLRCDGRRQHLRISHRLAVIGILFYVGAGVTHIVPWIMGERGEAVDDRGYGWQVHDIRESTVAILLLTMVFTALLAGLRLLRQANCKGEPIASISGD